MVVAAAMHSVPTSIAGSMRLRGAGAEIKRMTSQDVIAVYSKKDRLRETLSDWMRDKTLDDPAMAELEQIFHGIQSACRSIADMVGKSGIQDMTGFAGTGENVQGEEQKKLDILSNDVFKDKLKKTGCIAFLGSEEEDKAIALKGKGDYVAVFDPLDGSSNIDAAISVGTIFGIYKGAQGKDEFPLQCGKEQVAAGYCMYSTCTILMITVGDGAHGFTLDSSTGEFVLTHPDVKIPKRGKIYSTNQGNVPSWPAGLKTYFEKVSMGDGESKAKYSLRYIGSMVGDLHRTLLYGGLFLYPQDAKNPNGKLRLLYEASPMAFLVEQAGGSALLGPGQTIMDVKPSELHQRVPIYIGSKEDVEEVTKYL
jgi:fructose-1,6-bisphosphatase I